MLTLLFRHERINDAHQVTKAAYESLFVVKYETERLLTTGELQTQKELLFKASQTFQHSFEPLKERTHLPVVEWSGFAHIIVEEIQKIRKLLQAPIFDARSMMEKSLLRRLGEGLVPGTHTESYVQIRDLTNSIAYLKQYEDFLLDELHRLEQHEQDQNARQLERIKFWLLVLILSAIATLITLAFSLSKGIKKIETNLLGSQEHLRAALFELEQKQKNLEDQRNLLDHMAHHDALTGIPNRLLFLEKLRTLLDISKRTGERLAVWFIDLDRFKEINDSFGHNIGDIVLQEVAERLSNALGGESVARLGGDEFALIVENIHDQADAQIAIERFMTSLLLPLFVDNHEIYITCSAGASLFPRDAQSAEALLRNADSAMYHAKDEGKNTYAFYNHEMTKRAYERVTMESALRKALKNRELVLHYQPQIDMRNGKIVGFEALVRWQHPELGLVSPAKFIPIAEETGLIIEIGWWVLETACYTLKEWRSEGLDIGYMAVNLSAKQLLHGQLEQSIPSFLERIGYPNNALELELTESMIMKNPEHGRKTFARLRAKGIKIAIDDFGTGYSSLAYLRRLPIDTLKIDQSFVRPLPGSNPDGQIVRSIIHLCQGLGLGIIAEGVETQEQAAFLYQHGCTHAQGYLYAKPLDPKGAKSLLAPAQP